MRSLETCSVGAVGDDTGLDHQNVAIILPKTRETTVHDHQQGIRSDGGSQQQLGNSFPPHRGSSTPREQRVHTFLLRYQHRGEDGNLQVTEGRVLMIPRSNRLGPSGSDRPNKPHGPVGRARQAQEGFRSKSYCIKL